MHVYKVSLFGDFCHAKPRSFILICQCIKTEHVQEFPVTFVHTSVCCSCSCLMIALMGVEIHISIKQHKKLQMHLQTAVKMSLYN